MNAWKVTIAVAVCVAVVALVLWWGVEQCDTDLRGYFDESDRPTLPWWCRTP